MNGQGGGLDIKKIINDNAGEIFDAEDRRRR